MEIVTSMTDESSAPKEDAPKEETEKSGPTTEIDYAKIAHEFAPLLLQLYELCFKGLNGARFDAIVGKNGRLVIPQATRLKHDIKEGDIITLKVTETTNLPRPGESQIFWNTTLNSTATNQITDFNVSDFVKPKAQPKKSNKKNATKKDR